MVVALFKPCQMSTWKFLTSFCLSTNHTALLGIIIKGLPNDAPFQLMHCWDLTNEHHFLVVCSANTHATTSMHTLCAPLQPTEAQFLQWANFNHLHRVKPVFRASDQRIEKSVQYHSRMAELLMIAKECLTAGVRSEITIC